ncbi:hypothetical protein E2C01_081496 [Portunus trituberculatus]|uniref:Uncharacterized protein n=1 Tax=Portunus trituberculatus TaxID=210409 RepID=A0A5B7IPY1_PORTR|nr:hypothetical protein [Portunus trituberculatus]
MDREAGACQAFFSFRSSSSSSSSSSSHRGIRKAGLPRLNSPCQFCQLETYHPLCSKPITR